MRFPQNILKSRVEKFQEKMKSNNIDATMIRTLSSYAYFTGIKWLRPALLIPADGEPIAYVARGEEEGFMEKTWIRIVETFVDGGDLMRKVSSRIRNRGFKNVGLEFGVERDAYILFYEMFRRLNPGVNILDVSDILDEMKMIKDEYELQAIKKAGVKASKAIEDVLEIVKPGVSETEIAGEIYAKLYKMGAEHPLVYVNAGPHPRVHSEPLYDNRVRENTFLTIVVDADHDGYYVNKAVSIFVGQPNETVSKAIKCMDEVYEYANSLTRPGRRFIDVIMELDKIYRKYGLIDYRVVGYAHSVGLKAEETPITTIVPKHRFINISTNMVLSYIHAPLLLPKYGQVKKEDTFIIDINENVKIT